MHVFECAVEHDGSKLYVILLLYQGEKNAHILNSSLHSSEFSYIEILTHWLLGDAVAFLN